MGRWPSFSPLPPPLLTLFKGQEAVRQEPSSLISSQKPGIWELQVTPRYQSNTSIQRHGNVGSEREKMRDNDRQVPYLPIQSPHHLHPWLGQETSSSHQLFSKFYVWGQGCKGRIPMVGPRGKRQHVFPVRCLHLPQSQSLTSIISKMLSGSRLPFPTFLMHVTTPVLVTDTSKLAKEQASS